MGPFLDATDGNTEMTGLTIANTDIKVWKTGATSLANKNSGGATHISNGIYYAVFDATDSNTIGPMVVFIHVATALAVKVECRVLDEAVYDALYGTTALATATNITAGTLTTVTNLTNAPTNGDLTATMKTSVTTAATAATPTVAAVTANVTLGNNAIANATFTAGTAIPRCTLTDTTTTVTNNVTLGSNAIANATFAAGTAIPRCTLVDTLTTYTGDTPQTGDSFARIGANGAGLSNITLPSGGLANVTAWTVALTGNITGNLSGSVGSVTANVSISNTTLGYIWTLTDFIDTGITPKGGMRIILASAAGELSGANSTTIHMTNPAGSSTVITATVDSDGNRTAITVNPTY